MVVSNRVAFWDGENFVIVTKKCTKEQATKMMQALAAIDLGNVVLAADADAEPIEEAEEEMPVIPESIQQELAPRDPVFAGGRYSGMTPMEVLKRDKGKGFGNLAYLLAHNKIGTAEMREAIVRAQHAFFKEHFGQMAHPDITIAKWNEEQCKSFLTWYGSIMTDEDRKAVCSQTGELDFDEYIAKAELNTIQSLIMSVIEKYTK